MNDSRVSRQWLLCLVTLPASPAYARVKLHRHVRRIGAAPLKGGLFLLPDDPESRIAFHAMAQEVTVDGGVAATWTAKHIEGVTDRELIAIFDADRDEEYAEFLAASSALEQRWGEAPVGHRQSLVAERTRTLGWLEEILGRDRDRGSRREEAMQALERLAVLDIGPGRPSAPGPGTVSP